MCSARQWNQMANSLLTLSGWIWVWQTQRRNRNSLVELDPCLLKVWLFMISFICAQICTVFRKKKQQQQQTEIWLILVSQELFERRVVVHFTLGWILTRFGIRRTLTWQITHPLFAWQKKGLCILTGKSSKLKRRCLIILFIAGYVVSF